MVLYTFRTSVNVRKRTVIETCCFFCLSYDSWKLLLIYEPRSEKTGLSGFGPGLTQTRLYNHRRWLEA